jgi:hypothetical protein
MNQRETQRGIRSRIDTVTRDGLVIRVRSVSARFVVPGR